MFLTLNSLHKPVQKQARSRKHPGMLVASSVLAAGVFAGIHVNAQKAVPTDKPTANPATKKSTGAKPTGKAASANKPVANAMAAPTPAQLAYQFTPGTNYRYRLTALFDGHFPPFAHTDEPPIHIKVDLVYVATVKKADKSGATVDFNVDSCDLTLYPHELKENKKVDPKDVITFPFAVEEVQKALNATAVLHPDGSVANILTKSNVKIQIDVGFDIRKLFLLLMPVTLSNQPVKIGDTWQSTDGVLGSKAGRIAYTNKLADAKRKGKDGEYALNQTATSTVEDKLDKEGNSTTNPNETYGTLTGKIDLSADMVLSTPLGALPGPLLGQVKSAHILMNANVNRKRVKIDPDHPEVPENDPLDVKARMTIVRENAPAKTGSNRIADADTKPKSGKPAVPGNSKPALPGDKTAAGSK